MERELNRSFTVNFLKEDKYFPTHILDKYSTHTPLKINILLTFFL